MTRADDERSAIQSPIREILIIDDNVWRELIVQELDRFPNVAFTEAATGLHFHKRLSKLRQEPPAIVIADVNLPAMAVDDLNKPGDPEFTFILEGSYTSPNSVGARCLMSLGAEPFLSRTKGILYTSWIDEEVALPQGVVMPRNIQIVSKRDEGLLRQAVRRLLK